MKKQVGIDIGSTTIKAVVTNEQNTIIFQTYYRHKSSITKSFIRLLEEIQAAFSDESMFFNVTGSASMFLAKALHIQFTQEVISATEALRETKKEFDCCIELGGEDAKIIFYEGDSIEQRMNGTCAGGTGAFIDQMATLLDTDVVTLNELAKSYEKIYPIASRCGVFAKSDIQPLLNQGANHNDIAVSIYQAIVNQTIAGLSQGKKIKGRVAFLGGPLTFSSELRKRFIETLDLTDVYLPDHGEVFVAYGASLTACETEFRIQNLIKKATIYHETKKNKQTGSLPPLFQSKAEYNTFITRHEQATVHQIDPAIYNGDAYVGIDAGSTTTKLVLLSEDNEILFQFYSHNKGTPVDMVKFALEQLYDTIHDGITIQSVYSTGYGEELIKHAFHLDGGEVETICHYEASKFFMPNVEFIVDIGGQDMKCFHIEDHVITDIILNEACSSGCGSFLETFATSLEYEIKEFAQLALFASNPVDLGSRCTVFMNSGVKQAQAEGASSMDISAGLAYSVVKNALYKVIRAVDVAHEFGTNIIVQGGTFHNDGVLRAFEREIGLNVVRPNIAGLMGAFGAALVAKKHPTKPTTMLQKSALHDFHVTRKHATCKLCHNQCALTVNIFKDGKKYISGNRCERGAGVTISKEDIPNLYLYKYNEIMSYQSKKDPNKTKTIGIPLVLNMYENIPFWFTFFDTLGYRVIYSDRSSKTLYETGQDTIPSDTACYPAKLVHGHIINMLQKDIDLLFYPNMPFNVIEKDYRDNEYNCPIVAFYPEVIHHNMDDVNLNQMMSPYVSFNNKKKFIQHMKSCLEGKLELKKKHISKAYDKALEEYKRYRQRIQLEGHRAYEYAKSHNKNIIVLAGRPYHIDPEINHGLPKLLRTLDVVVLSEDSVNLLSNQEHVNVLNQWTYHTRLYDSAKWITTIKDANYIQLVSFGCGLDAITSDEIRDILEQHNKLYTQIKIDEVNNLGAATIRIRSLLSTMNGGVMHGDS